MLNRFISDFNIFYPSSIICMIKRIVCKVVAALLLGIITHTMVFAQSGVSEEKPLVFLVRVLDNETQKPLEVKMSLAKKSGEPFSPPKAVKTGVYQFDIYSKESESYALSIEKSSYTSKNMKITLPGNDGTGKQVIRRQVKLMKEGRTDSEWRNVYFGIGKTSIPSEYYPELSKIEKSLNENSSMKLDISGHADTKGSRSLNQKLSQKRADAVVNYLVKKGINSARLTAKGYGESDPIANNDDEKEGRELNRRVEFRIQE